MASTPEERVARLTRLLDLAGAREPGSWATSEVVEDIPQLARYLFLRQAWARVVRDGDVTWIDAARDAARRRPNDPCAGIGPALDRLLAAGADRADISEVVRTMQYELLFAMCYLLDDPSLDEPELADVAWGLFELDEEEKPLRRIGGLHEDALATDPTGRGMRPRRVV